MISADSFCQRLSKYDPTDSMQLLAQNGLTLLGHTFSSGTY